MVQVRVHVHLNLFINTTSMQCVRGSVRIRRCLPTNHPQTPGVQTLVPQHCLASQLCSYCEAWPANTDITLCVPLPLTVTFTYTPATVRYYPFTPKEVSRLNDFFLTNKVFPCPNHPNTLCQTPCLFPKYIFSSVVVMQHFFSCATPQHPSTLLSWVSPHVCSSNSRGGWRGDLPPAAAPTHLPTSYWRMEITHHTSMLPRSQTSKHIARGNCPNNTCCCVLGWGGEEDWPAQRVTSLTLPKQRPWSHQIRAGVRARAWKIRPPLGLRCSRRLSHTSV